MDISFLESEAGDLNDFELCRQKWGKQMARIIARRLNEVRSVLNLKELLRPGFPGNWHGLAGDRKGQFSANLIGPKRLITVPEGNPEDYMESKTINTKKVVALVVVEIVDYHS